MRIHVPNNAAERFLSGAGKTVAAPSYCRQLGPCRVWTAHTHHSGYGQFYLWGKLRAAHRVAFLLHHGRWPSGYVLHRCDNKRCVNPDHLFEGSHRDNMDDMMAKGRQARGDLKRQRGERNGSAKLTELDVRRILKVYEAGHVTQASLALEYGVNPSLISLIVHGKVWSHIRSAQ